MHDSIAGALLALRSAVARMLLHSFGMRLGGGDLCLRLRVGHAPQALRCSRTEGSKRHGSMSNLVRLYECVTAPGKAGRQTLPGRRSRLALLCSPGSCCRSGSIIRSGPSLSGCRACGASLHPKKQAHRSRVRAAASAHRQGKAVAWRTTNRLAPRCSPGRLPGQSSSWEAIGLPCSELQGGLRGAREVCVRCMGANWCRV